MIPTKKSGKHVSRTLPAAVATILVLALIAAACIIALANASAQGTGRIGVTPARLLYAPGDTASFDILVDSGGRGISGQLVLRVYPQASPLSGDAFNTNPIFETVINKEFSVSGQARAGFEAKTDDLKVGEGGYPVKVSLVQNGAEVLAGTSWLAVTSGAGREPLDLVMLWTVGSPPQRDPQGRFTDASLLDRCREAPATGYSIGQNLAMAQKYPQLKTSYALEPSMLDELADLADGFDLSEGGEVRMFDAASPEAAAAAASLDSLRQLTRGANTEVISAPFSHVNLPTLAKQNWDDGSGQFRIGHDVMLRTLGLEEAPAGTYAPDLDVTTDSLRYLAATGGEFVVLAGSERASVQGRGIEGAVNYRLRDLGGERITGFFADDAASWALLGSNPDPNAFFAALANAYVSGDPNRLVIAAAPVGNPAISAGERDRVYGQLAGLPWINSLTLGDARNKYRPDAMPATLLRYEDPLTGYVSQTYYDRLDAVHGRFEDYRTAVDNDEPELVRTVHQMYTAENSWWLGNDARPEDVNRGLEYLSTVDSFVNGEIGKLHISVDTPLLQRSSDGEATVKVTNDNLYAFTLDIVLEGNEGVTFPEGFERKQRIEAGKTFEFKVPYSSGGWSRLTARATARGNTLVEDSASIHAIPVRIWVAIIILLVGALAGSAYFFLVVRRR